MSIEIKNRQIFGKVVLDAMTAINTNPTLNAADKKRWQNALKNGVSLINERPEFLTWRPELNNQLLIWSNSNEIYEANGVCQCKAYEQKQPCKHRAAAKIIRNYFEAVETAQAKFSAADRYAAEREFYNCVYEGGSSSEFVWC